jgi:glyoxylase-like metal-dependent hydrolase (beta-lactamase superfamily II)
MCFWFESEKLIVSGDTLFRGGIGRTDLWGGDSGAIVQSIRQELYTLDEEAVVIPGHGPKTILGDEMRNNPFVQAID